MRQMPTVASLDDLRYDQPMRIAIIADAHGNFAALEAVLESAVSHSVDAIIAAGDMVNPFPGSKLIWDKLRESSIEYLRGNQEEFLAFYEEATDDDPLRASPRFMPIQYAASLFTSDELREMGTPPLTRSVGEPDAGGLLVCHASPFDPWRSIASEVDHSLEAQFRRVRQSTIVAAHLHKPWRGEWQGKRLALCGSLGIPMEGDTDACYMIAEELSNGWRLTDVRVGYDRRLTIETLCEAEFATKAGPIGWLLLADYLHGERHLMAFFSHAPHVTSLSTYDEYAVSVRSYLVSAGILETMQKTFQFSF